MGFSSQLDLIRSLLLRLHVLSKRKRRLTTRHAVGCVGRLRSLSIPTLSSLRSWREEPPEQRRRRRRKQKRDRKPGHGVEEVIVCTGGLPSEEEEFGKLTAMHPGYLETLVVDELRDEEYGELQEDGHVCLDYSGHGLFSQLQQELDSSSSSFAITHIPADLFTQALHGRPNEGTVESDIRRRVMRFLNIQEGEYGMVFTASKGSAFKLLAQSYPFDAQRNLLTMFDYESEAVRSMEEAAQSHGAKTLSASFNFPSLSVCSADLKSQILCQNEEDKSKSMSEDMDLMEDCGDKAKKRRKKKNDMRNEECSTTERMREEQKKGLFVFPVQSRVSGTKYSYQWMSLAQDNGWHVLLDASALGPKDMDSLGLSLFRPDFIITSFYKVFGSDPTGFGCLFVKNSSMDTLLQSEATRSIGMVRLIPIPDTSSPTNIQREGCDRGFQGRSTKKDFLSHMKSSKEEPLQAEVAFSGPTSTFFRWKASTRGPKPMKMGACLEENNEGESASLKVATGHKHDAQGKERMLQTSVENSKTPITPRSVLEESLLEGPDLSHDGESHELDGCASQEEKTHLLLSGESTEKFLSSSQVDSLRSALAKREFTTYYSQEITRHGNPSTSKGAFSQPLISRDIRENPFLVHSEGSSYYDELEFSSSLYDEDEDEDEDEESNEYGYGDDSFHARRREPEIYCRGLNHADSLGLNKTNDRLRFLTNWLITSMMKLQHLVSNKFGPLVHLYGPKVKYDRGASLAFNVFDQRGALVKPYLVQELAQRDNISLGLGVLSHIRFAEGCTDAGSNAPCGDLTSGLSPLSPSSTELQVVTAALGFFTNFEDVYRLWAFVAKFLDVEFA